MNPRQRRHLPGLMTRFTIITLITVVLLATSAAAQIPSGTILGRVMDAQGGVIPGATVTATNLGTQFSRTTTTDHALEPIPEQTRPESGVRRNPHAPGQR